ncbi:MAG TPA: alpha/beta fold hydrolase, partial [bacterium]|nr:alpha/beta fold hydrolase [bacterium]
RPRNAARPPEYRALRIPVGDGEWVGAWAAPGRGSGSRGTVLVFHGYGGEKSAMLPEAEAFRAMGYRVLLVDFRGGGESSGDDVTIGYREAEDVRAAWRHVRGRWREPRGVVFGVSMGAAACLRAMSEYADVKPRAAVLESSFGSTYQTVVNRFRVLGVPPVPLAALLTFWGGAQHGYWAFGHDPEDYARRVRVPTLLLQGERDERVTLGEAQRIYAGLAGPKRLWVVPGGGHGHYVLAAPEAWRRQMGDFLIKN